MTARSGPQKGSTAMKVAMVSLGVLAAITLAVLMSVFYPGPLPF